MPAERYYLPHFPFQKHQEVVLEGPEFHHLVHVMRSKVGDLLEIVNGHGDLAKGMVASLSKRGANVVIEEVIHFPPPQYACILVQAIPRLNRLDTILEKATELGATEMILFPGDRSERKTLTDSQQERMASVTIAAMKQCGRYYLPSLQVLSSLEEWKKGTCPLFFGDLSSEAPWFSEALRSIKREQGLAFATGPEGGFSDKEEEMLRSLGARGVKLHENILRTDTASIVALSLMSHL